MARLLALLGALLLGFAHAEKYMNLTTLTGKNNVSVLECWQLSIPFQTDDEPGVKGLDVLWMGELANASTTVIPGRFDGGLHNAPFKQWVWFITGVIQLSLPNGTGTALVNGGKYGLIYADDTKDISGWGHETVYPGADETIALTIPVQDGINPNHTVLHDGPCILDEQIWI
ncbi:hypothetical protein F4804DRAFT_304795 [Jackrogersella minutella]|nr:hypothetical protein F4804DRAFT_304795 [Jackrogersella minutella]